MNFNDFFALIKENTSNRLQNYKELCRFCLQHKSDGIDISADNYNTSQQRDTLLNNHLIITKQYVRNLFNIPSRTGKEFMFDFQLVISEEYPTFVCSSCESDLSQYALFVQQIENNSANWEIFLNTHNDVKVETDANIDKDEDTTTIEIEQIKVEYCEGNNVTNTQTYDIFDPSSVKNEIKKESLIDREILNDTVDNSTNRKKRIKKLKQPKSSDRQRYRVTTTTEYDRTCRLCDEPTFSSFRSLYKHQMQVHPGSKILSCDMCDAKFGFKGPLISHMNERHSSFSKKHQCQFCAKLFFSDRGDCYIYLLLVLFGNYLSLIEVKGHEKTHTNNRTYKCSLCGKGFNDKSSLNSHYKSKTHNPHLYKAKKARLNEISRYKIVYRCELCKPSIGFTSRKERNDHRNLVHRTFECDVCKNLFMAQESLDSHKLLHSDKPRPYVCEVSTLLQRGK